jgi:hypothetical protein
MAITAVAHALLNIVFVEPSLVDLTHVQALVDELFPSLGNQRPAAAVSIL